MKAWDVHSNRWRKEAARRSKKAAREQAAAKAEAVLDNSKREHNARAGAIEAERAVVEKRSEAEDARW